MRDSRFPSTLVPLAVAIGLGLLISSEASSQELGGRAIVSYQLFGGENVDTRSLLQLYEARFEHGVSDVLRFHLFFRAQGTDARYEFPLFTQKSSYWKLQPSGEIDYMLPRLSLVGTYDLYDTTSTISEVQFQQLYQRITQSLAWSPDRAPTLTLQAQELENREPSAGINQTENLLYQALSYTWKGLRLGQAAYFDDLELNQPEFSRKTTNLQGLFNYQHGSADGRYSVAVNGIVGYSRIDESTGAQAVDAPTLAAISSAAYSHDETPADARDVALAAAPGLIDGVFSRSAGISLGPDGSSFQNISLTMSRFFALDTIRVFVRDEAGRAIQFGGLVRWDVYVSGEGLDWTPVLGGETTVAFIASLSAYEVRFPKVNSRFYKIVSFGTNTIPTYVTEVQAFYHVALAGQQTRQTKLKYVSANAQLSGTPTRWLNLSYYGIFDDYKVADGGAPEYASTDNDQIVSALFGLNSPLNLTVRYERRRAASAGFDQQFDGAWAVAQYTFNPNLITSFEAARTKDTNLREITTNSFRFHNYARLFPSLDLSVDLGTYRNEFPREAAATRQNFLNLVSYSQLTEQLHLTLSANLQSQRNEGGLLPARTINFANYYGEVFYRPGSQLLLSARLGYVVSSLLSTSTRRFQVQWYPFAGGTFGIGTQYEDDVDTDGGFRRFRRLQIMPQWTLNPNVTLNLSYNLLNLGGTGADGQPLPESSSRQFFLTLIVTR
jgi:hypothetical protein